MDGFQKELQCSFCGKTDSEVEKIIVGPNHITICNECVEQCMHLIAKDKDSAGPLGVSLYTPQQIKQKLDEYITGSTQKRRQYNSYRLNSQGAYGAGTVPDITGRFEVGSICGKTYTKHDDLSCQKDADCADGLKCSKQKKCRIAADVDLAGYECTEASVSCQNGVKLTCEEDGWSDPWDPTFSSYTTVCAQDGKVCATSGSVSECMVPCDKVGASYKECVGSEYDNLVTYTCTEVDGVKVFVPQAQTCDCRVIPENNSAQCG